MSDIESQDTQRDPKRPSKEAIFEAASFFLLLTQIASVRSGQKRRLEQWHQHVEALKSHVRVLGRKNREAEVAGELTEHQPCDDETFCSVLSPLESLATVQHAANRAGSDCQPTTDQRDQWSGFLAVLKIICGSKEFFTTSKRRLLAERTSSFLDLVHQFLLSPIREKRSAFSPECSEKRQRSAGGHGGAENIGVQERDGGPAVETRDVEHVLSAVADLISTHAFFLLALSNHAGIWRLLDGPPGPGMTAIEWKHAQFHFLQLLERIGGRLVTGREQALCLLPRLEAYSDRADGLVRLYVRRILRHLGSESFPAE